MGFKDLVAGAMNWHKTINDNNAEAETRIGSLERNLYNPNLLINSNFRASSLINQRKQVIYDLASYNQSYIFDQFRLYRTGTNTTGYVDVNGEFVKLVKIDGDSTIVLEQRIEKFKDYAGKTVTFSAKVKTANIGDRFILYVNIDGLNTVHIFKTSTSNDWEVHYINIDVPVGINTNMDVKISNVEISELEISYLKLELGEIATEFVDDDIATKLNKCYRYLQEICIPQTPFLSDSSNQMFIAIDRTTRMRLATVTAIITSPLLCLHRISNGTVQTLGVKGDAVPNAYIDRSTIELLNYNSVQLIKGELYTINNSNGAGNFASGSSWIILSAEL